MEAEVAAVEANQDAAEVKASENQLVAPEGQAASAGSGASGDVSALFPDKPQMLLDGSGSGASSSGAGQSQQGVIIFGNSSLKPLADNPFCSKCGYSVDPLE